VCIASPRTRGRLADAPADARRDPEVEGLAVSVEKAAGEKCERCWIYSEELGTDPAYPTLCPRCAAVVRGLGRGEA
uniref:zinc finger domain-containing protein n=1 Tax=uncultured Desulfovibrio sp. TaxID=167968 RepID=UPI00262E84CB